MQIAIIGTGNVGSAIARGLRGKGHSVVLGSRSLSDAALRALAAETGSALALPVEAAAQAELVILALPWSAAETAVKALGNLAGKTVIDCMNPLGMADGTLGLTIGHTDSGGETVQRWLPAARVVKTLNQVGAEMMAENASLPHRPVQFIAGNEAGAKLKAAALLSDLGFEALDAGDISKSRLLEALAMVWINQSMFRGKGRNWAFAAITA